MKDLFSRCLNATYTHTTKNGDYAVEVERDTLYLLFEWSRGRLDWFHNLLFPAKPYKNMSKLWFCHMGFLRVWRAMRDEVEKKVLRELKLHPRVRNIVCIGYSHGGAISLFATEDMEYLYGDAYYVKGYGFGAPRVVWGLLPRAVKNRLQSFKVVRNVPDLVTHVPPVLLGFRHVGEVICIGEKKKYTPIKAHYPSAYEKELGRDSEKGSLLCT